MNSRYGWDKNRYGWDKKSFDFSLRIMLKKQKFLKWKVDNIG